MKTDDNCNNILQCEINLSLVDMEIQKNMILLKTLRDNKSETTSKRDTVKLVNMLKGKLFELNKSIERMVKQNGYYEATLNMLYDENKNDKMV
jgi:hypothetical protein